jgi:putative tryptophan/tyrosine transport system substrate-binding protein
MRRRDFITAVSAVIAPPLVAGAQQEMPLIGFLSSRSPEDTTNVIAAFRSGLAESGFIEGQTVAIEYRFARGQYDELPKLAAELASEPIKVLVSTGGELSALAAKAATSVIPIVFTIGSDPVKLGLVASYARPGGNITGINILASMLETKRLTLLHELIPKATTIAVMADPKFSATAIEVHNVEQAAHALGLKVRVLRASTDDEIDAAFAMIAKERILALALIGDPFYDTRRAKLVALSAQYKLPTMFYFREFAVDGGLASYGVDVRQGYRQAAEYTARILKGARPADLPVIEPTKFEFVINLKTASTMGVEVPPSLSAEADEVIE